MSKYVSYEELDEKTKLMIERIDKILKERLTSKFEGKLVDVRDYIDDVLWTLRLVTDSECTYEFDNKPLIWNIIHGRDRSEHVKFETAIDMMDCEKYEIRVTLTRFVIKLGVHHLYITGVIDVNTFVKRGESK